MTVDAIMALADEYARAAVDTFREEEGYSVPDADVKAARVALAAAITDALQAERERCAVVCDDKAADYIGARFEAVVLRRAAKDIREMK